MESTIVGGIGFLVIGAMGFGWISEQTAVIAAASLAGYLMARFVDMLRLMTDG